MARLSFRCDEELVKRVDAERGLVPREAWLRRTVEQALVDDDGGVRGRPHASISGSPDQLPAPAERPRVERVEVWDVRPDPAAEEFGGFVRSSSQAKRDVRPVPKKGERS